MARRGRGGGAGGVKERGVASGRQGDPLQTTAALPPFSTPVPLLSPSLQPPRGRPGAVASGSPFISPPRPPRTPPLPCTRHPPAHNECAAAFIPPFPASRSPVSRAEAFPLREPGGECSNQRPKSKRPQSYFYCATRTRCVNEDMSITNPCRQLATFAFIYISISSLH